MTRPDPDPEAIRATYRWLAHAPHGVTEVRAIRPPNGILGIGFFDDEEAFVRECVRANAIANVYAGIQPRPRRLLAMAENALRPIKSGARRGDIEVVTATVIDLDPVRPKDTASTQEELAQATAAAVATSEWFEKEGLLRPRRVMSGNGVQLWCAFPPIVLEDASRETVQANLKVLETEVRARFESDAVKVDSIHDLARIIKVAGTVSLKGEHTAERPHRLSVMIGGTDRVEDLALAARLMTPVPLDEPAPKTTRARPAGTAQTLAIVTPARRTSEGDYDWEAPVEMCGPVQRLWDQGHTDRSLAIFDMVRFFMHKGLPLSEITELVVEYDRRGLGKLKGRDGAAYVRNCHDKILESAGLDSSVAPPCHSLQKIGYCRVNEEPGVRCELYDHVFDIEKAVLAVPEDLPARDLEYRLKPILEAIAHRNASFRGRYLDLVATRFGLKPRDVRAAVDRIQGRERRPAGGDDSAADAGGESAIEGEIYEDRDFYYTLSARDETRVISSFTITPSMRVETEEGEIILGRAHTDRGTTIEDIWLPLRAFHSKRDLIRHLARADLQWTGSDNNVQGLLRILARRPVPSAPGTTMLGDYDRGGLHLWVGPEGVIGCDGLMTPSPVIYVPSGGSLDTRLHYRACGDEEFQAVARRVFEFLPRLNQPEVIIPVIGWFFASAVKPRLMKSTGSFPILFIWGTQGSGKTSLCTEVFWPLFGIRDAEPYSATETEFALVKLLSSTRSVPVFIDEYKPYDMPRHRLNALHRYIRRLYRGEVEERGRPDQTVSSYHLQAPLCVAGETRPVEAALLERILTANPEKAVLEEEPAHRAALRELKATDLSLFAPRYIQFCLGRDVEADIALARDATARLLAGRTVPLRVAANVSAMVLGLHLFEEFARACGYDALPEDLGVREAVGAVLDDVLETDHGVKNALDHFLEMLGVMAIAKEIEARVHYVFKNDILWLHLESAYDAFRQHCRRIDYDGEVVDLKALRRLVHESHRQQGYVTAVSDRVYFGSHRRWAVGIDPARTPLLDDFPREGAEA